MKRAFTLIELLVITLIIGILAAVALPQYQLAVAKSRVVSLLPLIKGIQQAQQLYYLDHGEYVSDFNQLDIEFPAGASISSLKFRYNHVKCNSGNNNGRYNSLYCSVENTGIELEQYYSRDTVLCWAHTTIGEKTCLALCGIGKLGEKKACSF